ncbi:rRNA-processing protein FCF2 [Delitschia confertaspora ATCC 74209]|uniref:rRNA-processing protein FCF2 n=1 Tax=Delitschia confertaspora ATCC 74209 TaxID=1513339 RepID=A0A9P4JZ34_9PLEO|nr:rRNA-processing protein FCF2 [Delitschia confertaspora ATCC 74209]
MSDSDEDLSDKQIRELLSLAEQRMKEKSLSSSNTDVFRLPRLDPGQIAAPLLQTDGSVTRLDRSQVAPKDTSLGIKKIEDPIALKRQKQEEKKATAGTQWYNMPATDVTPELRRDLQLLKMRNVVDPKRFYKKDNKAPDIPPFSQVGTIIEGPTEFFSGRLQNKERKKTFVEEALAQEAETGRFKKKYNEIQTSKTSGKKAYYKALKAKRKGRIEKR